MSTFERLEIWDDVEANSGVRLNIFPPKDVLKLNTRDRADAKNRMFATIKRDTTVWASIADRAVLRIVLDDLSFREWRIAIIKEVETISEGLVAQIECEDIRQDLLNGIIERLLSNGEAIYEFPLNQTPSDLITNVILPAAPTYFFLGTIHPTDIVTITFDQDNPLSALVQLAKITNTRLSISGGAGGYGISLIDDDLTAATLQAWDGFDSVEDLVDHTPDLGIDSYEYSGAADTWQTLSPGRAQRNLGNEFVRNTNDISVVDLTSGRIRVEGDLVKGAVDDTTSQGHLGVFLTGAGSTPYDGEGLWLGFRRTGSTTANIQVKRINAAGSEVETKVFSNVTYPPNRHFSFTIEKNGRSISCILSDLFTEANPVDLGMVTMDVDIRGALNRRIGITGISGSGATDLYLFEIYSLPSGDASAEFRIKKNITGLVHQRTVDQLATRVYPQGEAVDNIRLTMGEARWQVVSVATNDIVLVDPNSAAGPIAFDDQLNGLYLEKIDGTLTLINDTDFAAQEVTVASGTGVSADDIVKIRRNSAGDQLTFLDSPVDIIAFGVVPRFLDRSDIPFVQNVIANPELGGTYAGGVAPNWNSVGAFVTLVENTDLDFTQGGLKSQKVSSPLAGEGLESDTVVITPSQEHPFFAMHFNLWIVKGRVRVEIVDVVTGNTIPTGAEGRAISFKKNVWVKLGVAGVDLQKEGITSIRARIVVDGGIDTEFYVDWCQFTQTATHVPFFAGDGAARLWLEANKELAVHGVPTVSVSVAAVDLFNIDSDRWPFDELVLMDKVKISADNISVDVVTRIVQIDRDVLLEGAVAVILSNKEEDLTDAIFRPGFRQREIPVVDGRFDDPRIADPSVGPEQVNANEITFPIVFDPETARIEAYANEDTTNAVTAPGEVGAFHESTIYPGTPNLIIAGTSTNFVRSLFVAYDKNGVRGRTLSFGPTELASSGSGPTAAPTTLACGTETTTTVPLTWNNNGDGVSATRIWRDNILIDTVSGGTAAYVATGLTPGTTYDFEVDHWLDNQASTRDGVQCTTDTVTPTLDPPTNFIPTGVTSPGNGVEFTWDNGDISAHTIIERADNDAFTTNVIEIQDFPAGLDQGGDDKEACGEFWFRAFHRKTGYADSAPTADDFASYQEVDTCP